MARINYGSDLKGELFDFVHTVCETEMGVTMERDRTVRWVADQAIYPGYLALRHVFLKFPPNNRRNVFLVDGFELAIDDDDTRLALDRSTGGDLSGDSWAEAVFNDAKAIFDAHDHEACVAQYLPDGAETLQPIPYPHARNAVLL